MRRRAVLQGLQEEAELLGRLLRGQPEQFEDLGLHVAAVDADRAAAQLGAIDHEIVRLGQHGAGIAVQPVEVIGARAGEGVVHRVPTLVAVVELEHREVGHPQECPLGLVEEAHALARHQPQPGQRRVHRRRLVRHEQDQAAFLGAHVGIQLVAQVLGHALADRSRPLAVARHARPRYALGSVRRRLLGQRGVQVLAGERGSVGQVQGLDDAAARQHVDEHAELDLVAQDLGKVRKRQVEAQVRLVAAVLVHRFGKRHAPQRQGNRHAEHLLPHLRNVAFENRVDIVRAHERHLQIELGELGLAIGAQVLVAKAAADLHVAVHAADHEQLFEGLRRLRKRIEAARMHAARHQVVARAFRRGLHQDRRLQLEKALLLGEVLAGHLHDLGTHHEVLVQLRAAQVEVAVSEPGVLVGLDAVLDLEGRRLGLREHFDLLHRDLDLARGNLGIDVAAARDDLATRGDDPLAAHAVGDAVHVGRGTGLAGGIGFAAQLHDTSAIADVEKDDAAMIAEALHPAEDDGLGTDVGGAELAVVLGTLEVGDEAGHGRIPRFGGRAGCAACAGCEWYGRAGARASAGAVRAKA